MSSVYQGNPSIFSTGHSPGPGCRKPPTAKLGIFGGFPRLKKKDRKQGTPEGAFFPDSTKSEAGKGVCWKDGFAAGLGLVQGWFRVGWY